MSKWHPRTLLLVLHAQLPGELLTDGFAWHVVLCRSFVDDGFDGEMDGMSVRLVNSEVRGSASCRWHAWTVGRYDVLCGLHNFWCLLLFSGQIC